MNQHRSKIGLVVCLLLIATTASAQTQQGFVKTKGRMVNGQLQAGSRLSGAVISVRGRSAVLSQSNGQFSFPVGGKTFMLDSVRKKGYQLVDAEAASRTYAVSANPLYLLMETPEQQQADLLAAERKIRRNLRRQLDDKEAEIESLRNASQAEKDSLLRILYQQQSNNEKLIADMAKRYATLDYDQLDEFYRQVTYFIENGELIRADSLLRTRGDLNAQVQTILQQGQTIKEEEQKLNQAKAVHQEDIAEAARRCYSFYEAFLAQHQNDSAAYYLELRASLDTTNVEWQYQAGSCVDFWLSDTDKGLLYYQRTLRQSMIQGNEKSEWVWKAYNGIGYIYYEQGLFSEALYYCMKELHCLESIYGEGHYLLPKCYYNVGELYYCLGDYESALEQYMKALPIEQEKWGDDNIQVAYAYKNIGRAYCQQHRFHQAMDYLTKALHICEANNDSSHFLMGDIYEQIGFVYAYEKKDEMALEYLVKALSIDEKELGTEHPETKSLRNNINVIKYRISLSEGSLQEFLSDHVFTATIVEGDTPARQQGMHGEYILLEYADWVQESPTSLFDTNEKYKGHPKDIVVMKDDVISVHHFENVIGAQLGIKSVEKDVRQHINDIYENWKKNNRN